ncbi:MAG: YHYH domain-containing protein [Opitutales bacterium]
MKLLSFILLLLGLTQVVFSHSGRTDSKGGHWDRKAGTYHYHNQTTAPRPSAPSYSKTYSESFYQE